MSKNSGFQECLCLMVPNASRMKPKLLGGPSRFITPPALFLPSLCTPIIQPGQDLSYPELSTSNPVQSFLLAFTLNSKFPKPKTSCFMKLFLIPQPRSDVSNFGAMQTAGAWLGSHPPGFLCRMWAGWHFWPVTG